MDRRIQKTFFIDVIPKVKAEDIGYPFNLNRQQFTEAAGKEFGQVFLNVQKLFIEASHSIDAENFGEMRNLSLDTTTNKITSSAPFALKPAQPIKSAVTGISMGDNVDVKNGQLVVKGRAIPEITPKQAAEFKIDVSKLRIPQDKIPKRDILHDNTFVSPTGAPLTDTSQRISMTQYGVQKFGDRFYTYTFVMGRLLDEIRNVVKKYPGYSGLENEAVGLSLDQGYRGVSIRIPFSASFLNPFFSKYDDPKSAAIGMVTTMIYELAHHTHRSEKDLTPVFQDILTQLLLDPKV